VAAEEEEEEEEDGGRSEVEDEEDVRAEEAGIVRDDFVTDLRFSVGAEADEVVIDAPPDKGLRVKIWSKSLSR